MNKTLQIKAAVVIIPRKEGKILLFRRQNTGWEDGKYTVPSGNIDKGELPKEAALRELKEETGLIANIEDLKLVHIDFVKDSVINFYFIIEEWIGKPKLIELNKSSDMDWFDLDNLPENIAGHGAEVLAYIRNGILYTEITKPAHVRKTFTEVTKMANKNAKYSTIRNLNDIFKVIRKGRK
jgi:8-oxo-dGTP diphosphatase